MPAGAAQSRVERLRVDGGVPELPDVDAYYLFEYLRDAGPTIDGAALSWQELQAWQDQTGIELQPWEVRLVRRLSKDFVREARRATAPDCPPPFGVLARNLDLNRKLDAFLD